MSDYHSDFTHVSKTMLNLFFDSPVDYYHTYITRKMKPKPPTDPMKMGTTAHAVLLEDRPLSEVIAVYPPEALSTSGAKKTKCKGGSNPIADFEAANEGKVCMKESMRQQVANCLDSIRRHPLIVEVLRNVTTREHRYNAVLEGVPCKCRPDLLTDCGDFIRIDDFKCGENISPAFFRRTSKRIRYWLQNQHYGAVVATHFRKPVMFRFLAIEMKFPHRVHPYWYGTTSMDEVGTVHRSKLREIARCQESGEWKDNWDSELTLAPWDLGDELLTDEVQV